MSKKYSIAGSFFKQPRTYEQIAANEIQQILKPKNKKVSVRIKKMDGISKSKKYNSTKYKSKKYKSKKYKWSP